MDTITNEISERFRKRAKSAEQKISTAEDSTTRGEWALIAVEWHLLANAAAPRELRYLVELED